MQIIMTILICLSYIGGIISIVAFSIHDGKVRIDMVVIMLLFTVMNSLFARYLYKKVSTNKMAWALLSFIVSFNAIIIHWLYESAKANLKAGRRFFS